ncbi:MAG TPA: acyl-CoA dehydrogenase family protein, partial [Acidimicrobiales bacterium]
MDFNLTEEQLAVAELAERIFADRLTAEAWRSVAGGFDRPLWEALATAGLLGISLPSSAGGSGESFLTTALLLEQAGRHAAPVPLLATVVMGAMPIARFGSAEQQEAILPAVMDGSLVLTAALVEQGTEPGSPGTVAQRSGSGSGSGSGAGSGAAWSLDGAKTCVPAATIAGKFLVPAAVGAGVGVFLVDAADAGVAVTPLLTTAGSPSGHLELSGAAGALVGSVEDGP